jgi:8-amino-3,8-dideoxy-alpha-D-manno-octulosonate transaminase
MNELQGAVGLAQLKKLDCIIKQQNINKKAIVNEISDLTQIIFRTVPEGSEETAEALVFFVANNEIARRIRDELLKEGIGTKILPEAITWHFAGTWSHVPSLVEANGNDLTIAFERSREMLSKAVALPIFFNMPENTPQKIKKAINNVFL